MYYGEQKKTNTNIPYCLIDCGGGYIIYIFNNTHETVSLK